MGELPEKLAIKEYTPDRKRKAPSNLVMLVDDLSRDYVAECVQREVAKRIVAEWDACKGIETETLEKYGTEFPEVVADDMTDRQRADDATALLREVLEAGDLADDAWDQDEALQRHSEAKKAARAFIAERTK